MSKHENTIGWETWNDAGYRTRTSATHIENPLRLGWTLCGNPIPPEGNGIVHEAEGDGDCKRCAAVADRIAANVAASLASPIRDAIDRAAADEPSDENEHDPSSFSPEHTPEGQRGRESWARRVYDTDGPVDPTD